MKRVIILSLILSIFALGCGAKKINKSEVKQEEILDSSSTKKISEQIDFEVSKDVKLSEEEIVFEPIDSTKPIEITDSKGNVKKYKNVRIKKKNKEVSDNSKLKEKVIIDTYESEKKKIQKVLHTKDKIVEKKESVYTFWWVIILILILIGYRYFIKRILI